MAVSTQMRISEAHRAVIDRAAQASGKSRTEFMVSASLKEAEQVLTSQRIFVFESEAFDKFIEYLDAPPKGKKKLHDFLSQTLPWET